MHVLGDYVFKNTAEGYNKVYIAIAKTQTDNDININDLITHCFFIATTFILVTSKYNPCNPIPLVLKEGYISRPWVIQQVLSYI